MMIFFLYSIAIGASAAATAHCLERIAIVLGVATRGIWLAAIAVVIAGSAAAATTSAKTTTIVNASTPMMAAQNLEGALSTANVNLSQFSIESLDVAFAVLWITASSLVGLALLVSGIRMKARLKEAHSIKIGGRRVAVTRDVGPALLGVFRYSLVVPQWFKDLSDNDRALVLTHEEEHARTRDPVLFLVGSLSVVVLPWNVALWYIVKRLRTSIEIDCDLRVLQGTKGSADYLRLLVDVAERFPSGAWSIAALNSSVSQLESRLRAVSIRSQGLARRSIAMILGVSAVLGLTGAVIPRPTSPLPNLSFLRERGVEKRITAVVQVSSAASETVLIYTTGGATVDVGRGMHPAEPGTVRVKTPATIKADITVGQLHVVSVSGNDVYVSAFTDGMRMIAAKMLNAHAVLASDGIRNKAKSPVDRGQSAATKDPLYEGQVSRPAWLVAGSAEPEYPASLRAAGIEGVVIAQFIVDENGKPQPSTLKILSATNELFVASVRRALPSLQFEPAEAAHRPVKQLVMQDFRFKLDR